MDLRRIMKLLVQSIALNFKMKNKWKQLPECEKSQKFCCVLKRNFFFQVACASKNEKRLENTSKKREMTKKWIETFFSTKNKIGWAKHWVYFVIVNAWCLYNNRFSYWKCFTCQKDERRSKKIGERTKKPTFRQWFRMTNSCWDKLHAKRSRVKNLSIVKQSKIINNEQVKPNYASWQLLNTHLLSLS